MLSFGTQPRSMPTTHTHTKLCANFLAASLPQQTIRPWHNETHSGLGSSTKQNLCRPNVKQNRPNASTSRFYASQEALVSADKLGCLGQPGSGFNTSFVFQSVLLRSLSQTKASNLTLPCHTILLYLTLSLLRPSLTLSHPSPCSLKLLSMPRPV